MARQFTIKGRFEADDKASGKIRQVESRFKRLTRTIKSSAVAQIAAIAGVTVGITALARGFASTIRAANEQERAVNALNAALAPLGSRAQSVARALTEQASALQKVTTFGDEEIIKAQTLISSFVKEEAAIKAATAATLDFATGTGIDLAGAAALVAKSLGSTTNALTRYGIEVTGAVGSTERLNSLVENTARVFGGRATAEIKTFSGAVAQLGNVIGDQAEEIGALVTQNEDLVASINAATDAIPDFVRGLQEIAKAQREGAVAQRESLAGEGAREFFDLTIGGYAKLAQAITAKGRVERETIEATKAATDAQVSLALRQAESGAALLKQIGLSEFYTGVTTEAAKATEALAARLKRIDADSAQASTAMEKLGQAIGEVSASELERKIIEIQKALEEAREATLGNVESQREFAEKASVAEEQVKRLRERIESLRDGNGDLQEKTDDLAVSIGDRLVPAIGELDSAAGRSQANLRGMGSAAQASSLQFNALAASASRAFSVTGGGGGGVPSVSTRSRSSSNFGPTLRDRTTIGGFSNLSGGTFTTVQGRIVSTN